MFKRSVLLLDPFDAAVDALALPARLSGCMIGGSSSKSSSQSQQTSSPVINQPGLTADNANVARATGVVDSTFQPFNGQFTAGLVPNQQLALNAAPGMARAGAPQLSAAANTDYGLTGYQPPGYSPTMLPGAPQAGAIDPNAIPKVSASDISSLIPGFQNPYTQNVVNSTMNDLELQRERQRVADNQSATASGAFGGNRQGVADSLTNEAYDRTAASTLANLRSGAYDRAAGLAGQQASNNQAAAGANQGAALNVANTNAGLGEYNAGLTGNFDLANQGAANTAGEFNANAGLAGAGVRQTAANSLANAGGQMQTQFGNYISTLLATGQVDQNTLQSNLDKIYQEFLRGQQYPLQGQELINQSLGLVPVSLGQQSQGTSSGTGKSSAFNFTLPMPSGG